MFQRILIANRGEIACRIMTTARRLGVETVAIYSAADADARHVRMADIAVPIAGDGSYLDAAAIVDAAVQTGAEAIHPGYGFLSENPEFVDRITAAGLVFVGPPAAAIRAMGLKDAAKALMQDAGVPVVPGYHEADQDPARLASAAAEIGYPVLIKARAGGGGKGMRLVDAAETFSSALESASREGSASFGDGNVLIEKYISAPRHIEVQVFADSHGNVVHLFERDCTLQRRHQKVIEEAPAPHMPEEVRAAMCDAAVRAARSIGYQGAGTIEFIADGSGQLRKDGFWFMEMNTRLQVEHPVTEAVTGVDLVEWQLRVAAGEPLPLSQGDIILNGHAVEARLYAEDPRRDFMPAPGAVDRIQFAAGLRIDTGVEDGDSISAFYDPMIAKVICHAETRDAALAGLADGLAQTHLIGTATNIDFLANLLRHPDVVTAGHASDTGTAGRFDTGLIAREVDNLVAEPPLDARLLALAFVAMLPAGHEQGWRLWDRGTVRRHLVVDGVTHCRRLLFRRDGTIEVMPEHQDDDSQAIILSQPIWSDGRIGASHDGAWLAANFIRQGACLSLILEGARLVVSEPDQRSRHNAQITEGAVTAPMAGVVQLVDVSVGDAVRSGDRLLVLAAMKMEYALTAPRDGVVASVACSAGDSVGDAAVLVTLEDEDD